MWFLYKAFKNKNNSPDPRQHRSHTPTAAEGETITNTLLTQKELQLKFMGYVVGVDN